MPKSKAYVSSSGSGSESDEPKSKKTKVKGKVSKKEAPKKTKVSAEKTEALKGEDGETLYPLSALRNVSVKSFRGKVLVNIREYYEKDGKQLPGKKGISLTNEQWEKLKSYIPSIDEDIKNQ